MSWSGAAVLFNVSLPSLRNKSKKRSSIYVNSLRNMAYMLASLHNTVGFASLMSECHTTCEQGYRPGATPFYPENRRQAKRSNQPVNQPANLPANQSTSHLSARFKKNGEAYITVTTVATHQGNTDSSECVADCPAATISPINPIVHLFFFPGKKQTEIAHDAWGHTQRCRPPPRAHS